MTAIQRRREVDRQMKHPRMKKRDEPMTEIWRIGDLDWQLIHRHRRGGIRAQKRNIIINYHKHWITVFTDLKPWPTVIGIIHAVWAIEARAGILPEDSAVSAKRLNKLMTGRRERP